MVGLIAIVWIVLASAFDLMTHGGNYEPVCHRVLPRATSMVQRLRNIHIMDSCYDAAVARGEKYPASGY